MNHNHPVKSIPPKPILSSFYFFYYAALGVFIPYWSLYLEKVGFNKAEIGWLIGITMISRVFAPAFWGYVADKTAKSMSWVRLAVLAELLLWATVTVAPVSFSIFFVLMLLYSFFQNATVPLIEAVTLYWLGKDVKDYGKIRLWASIGFLIMVSGLGVLFDYVSIHVLPSVILVVVGLCFITAWLIKEPELATEKKHTDDIDKTIYAIQNGFYTVLRTKAVIWFYVAQFVLLLSHAPFYGFYSNYMTEQGYSTTSIGVLWSMGLVAEIILFIKSKSLLERFSQNSLMSFCLVMTGVRWLIVAIFPDSLVMQLLAQCCHAFSFALFQSVAMQFIHHSFASNQQARAQALYMTCWGLGVAIGTVVVGHFWDITGGVLWFALSGILVLVFGLIFLYIRPMPKGKFI